MRLQAEEAVLVLDVGNTHVHWARFYNGRIEQTGLIPTSAVMESPEQIGLTVEEGTLPQAVALASVVPKATERLQQFISRHWQQDPYVLTAQTVRGIQIQYPQPETIGADRLANAVAAARLYGAPVLVLDFGTALTFDIVAPPRTYIGGIIAPGLGLMRDALYERTALLPRVEWRLPQSVIGKSTEQAICIGVLQGYRHLVEGLVKDLLQQTGWNHCRIVTTGGDASLVMTATQLEATHDPELTLKGIYLSWKEAEQEKKS